MSPYLLIDGVMFEQALSRLYARPEELEIQPLYTGTRWHELADIGPILVQPCQGSTILQEVRKDVGWQNVATVMMSEASLAEIAAHLRHFNCVTDSLGSESLMRYADPLVAWFWLSSHSAAGLRRVLGPITEWQIAEPNASWQLSTSVQWHAFSSNDPPDTSQLNMLRKAQTQAFDQACRWRLKERLVSWLTASQGKNMEQFTPDTLAAWLDERLQSADTFGLTTERSIAIWLAISLQNGDGFVTAEDGAYLRWLNASSATVISTADQRLQRYFQEAV